MKRILILPVLMLIACTGFAANTPGTQVWPSEIPKDCPLVQSTKFAGLGFTGRFVNHGHADTWYPSWGADGRLYSPFTDGNVEGVTSSSGGADATIGHAVIEGDDVLNLKVIEPGTVAASPAPYGGRYPCACLHYNGVWYLGTYALANAPYGLNWPILGPFAGFHISKDNGKTWTKSPWGCEPGKTLFPEPEKLNGPLKLGVPHVVDFGKNMENSPDGKMYLVCHGATQQDEVDRKANLSWITGDQIYLCRVTPSPETINDPAQYEYFAGNDGKGEPVWSKDYAKIRPMIDWNNNCGGVTMTYNKPLKKYLMCVTDGRTTESRYNTYILESDRITGPWKMVTYMKDFGTEAYFVNIPSKFISQNGCSFWLCYSTNWMNVCWKKEVHPISPAGGSYTMSLHEVCLLNASEAKTLPKIQSPDRPNLALKAQATASSTHEGYNPAAVNDGRLSGFPSDPSAEWASNGEKEGAWIQLKWDAPIKIGSVISYDRPYNSDQVLGGELSFSDGTTIAVGELPDDGWTGPEVKFPPKTVTWVKFTATKVKPGTANSGLSEMAVFAPEDKPLNQPRRSIR